MLVPYGMGTEYEPGEIEIAESAICAVHLTFLKPDGSSKADVDPREDHDRFPDRCTARTRADERPAGVGDHRGH